MPIRRTLIGCRSSQNGLVAEPGADQLHADRHSFRTDAAGKGAAWQTEHAGEAQQIGMIVARVAGVVAIAFYAVYEERRDSGGSRRCDDVDFLIRGAHGFANPVARALGGEIFGCGDCHTHSDAPAYVRHVVLVPFAKPAAVDAGALGRTG